MTILQNMWARVVCWSFFALSLASCGSGNALSVVSLISASDPQHYAALGTLSGATVSVYEASQISTPLVTATTASDGKFKIELPPAGISAGSQPLYLIQVTGGIDLDANDDGILDTTPTPNKGTIYAIADRNMIEKGKINVTPLSDMLYRLIGQGLDTMSTGEALSEMARLTAVLLKSTPANTATHGDINGDGKVDYLDVLAFLPHQTDHRGRLQHDFSRYFSPIDTEVGGTTLINKYHAGDADITQAIRDVYFDLEHQKPYSNTPEVKSSYRIRVSVHGGGQVTSDLLTKPLTTDDEGVSIELPRDATKLESFAAVATDPEYRFHSWSGCTKVLGLICQAARIEDQSIRALFELKAPVIQEGIKSFDAVIPEAGKTGVRFDGNKVSFVTKDAALITKLMAVVVDSAVATGVIDIPLLKVLSIVSRTDTLGVLTAVFTFKEVAPHEVFSRFSAIAEEKPFSFDDVRGVTVAAGVTAAHGGPASSVVNQPKPLVNFADTVSSSSVLTTPTISGSPTYFIAKNTANLCKVYTDDGVAFENLREAFIATPKTAPFTEAALSSCTGISAVKLPLALQVLSAGAGETLLKTGTATNTLALGLDWAVAINWAEIEGQCRAYAKNPASSAALTAAFNADPKAFPFTNADLSDCATRGLSTVASLGTLLTDFDTDTLNLLAKGTTNNTGTLVAGLSTKEALAQRNKSSKAQQQTMLAKGNTPATQKTPTKEVWLMGIGRAFDLGDGMYMTDRADGQPGLRLLSMTDVRRVASADAYNSSLRDCGLKGNQASCSYVRQVDLEKRGLMQASVPFSAPLGASFAGEYKLGKVKIPYSGRISFATNLSVTSSAWFEKLGGLIPFKVSTALAFNANPELGLNVAVGDSAAAKAKSAEKKKDPKFKKKNVKKKKSKNKGDWSQKIISVDMSRFLGPAGAVFDLNFIVSVGVESSGEMNLEVKAGVDHQTKWDMYLHVRCEFVVICGKKIKSNLNSSTEPYINATLNGEAEVAPYANLAFRAGVRYVLPNTLQVHARQKFVLALEGETNMSWTGSKGFCANEPALSLTGSIGVEVFGLVTGDDWPFPFNKFGLYNKWEFIDYEKELFSFPKSDNEVPKKC